MSTVCTTTTLNSAAAMDCRKRTWGCSRANAAGGHLRVPAMVPVLATHVGVHCIASRCVAMCLCVGPGASRPAGFHATAVTALANPNPPGTPGNPGFDMLVVTTSDACVTVWKVVKVQGVGVATTHFVYHDEDCTLDTVTALVPLPGQCFASTSFASPVVTVWTTEPVRRLARYPSAQRPRFSARAVIAVCWRCCSLPQAMQSVARSHALSFVFVSLRAVH